MKPLPSNYYALKRLASIEVDLLAEDGKTYDHILYVVSTKFGLGDKFVRARLDLRERISNRGKNEV